MAGALDLSVGLQHDDERMTTTSLRGRLTRYVGLLVLTVSILFGPMGAGSAGASSGAEAVLEQQLLGQINAERAGRGLGPMVAEGSLAGASKTWAGSMAGRGGLVHSSDGRAEIIARGWGTGQITEAWMRSASHRNLIVDPNLVMAGVGVRCDASGQMWAVVQFTRADKSIGTLRSSSETPRMTASDAGSGCSVSANLSSVERLYIAYFLRPSDASGAGYWATRLDQGAGLATVSEAFAGSTEFQNRYGSLGNRDFVKLVYVNVLGREPDANGYGFWVGELDRGMARGEMMIGFSESAEFRTKTGLH